VNSSIEDMAFGASRATTVMLLLDDHSQVTMDDY
jgi:hypothetical protein